MTEEVTVEVESETPPADSGDTVVIVSEDGSSDNDLAIGQQLGALTVTVNALVEQVAEISNRLASTESTADTALSVAVDASIEAEQVQELAEEVIEAVEEANETEPDPIVPQREHWLWRKRGGLKPVD